MAGCQREDAQRPPQGKPPPLSQPTPAALSAEAPGRWLVCLVLCCVPGTKNGAWQRVSALSERGNGLHPHTILLRGSVVDKRWSDP